MITNGCGAILADDVVVLAKNSASRVRVRAFLVATADGRGGSLTAATARSRQFAVIDPKSPCFSSDGPARK